ncbi:hypothetical protein SASC598J21_003830, partial [Snodgrassella alvi SCGC AB-598-J21]
DLIEKLNRINSDFITSFFSALFYNDYKEVIQYISSIINSNKLVNKLSAACSEPPLEFHI